MNDHSFSIVELADRAGVTPRTIRYYTAEGLLPPPDTRGKYARYRQAHMLRLQLIARLKEAYLPLGEIRARLALLSDSDVQTILDEAGEPESAPTSSAIEYLSQLLGPRASTAQLAEAPTAYSPAPQPPPSPTTPRLSQPATPAPTHTRDLDQQRSLRTGRAERDAPGGGTAKFQLEERWRRVSLSDGIEVHIREPQTEAMRGRIEHLIALAQQVLTQPEGAE